ncbi:anti-sigma factor [Gordonia kroppenstedtii]|uniref:anti-sigma factor n=1 Tax=Jongsikchunia kroppenstedtii TaxID=1121721 RepID=UPI00039D3232
MATARSEVDWEGDSVVQLRVPAQVEQLAVIRAAVATVAASADLDIDAIADARLAADEACTELTTIAAERTTLDCRFTGEAGRLWLHCSTTARAEDVPFEQGLSWYVLRSIVTRLTTGHRDLADAPGCRRVWIEFCIENETHRAG